MTIYVFQLSQLAPIVSFIHTSGLFIDPRSNRTMDWTENLEKCGPKTRPDEIFLDGTETRSIRPNFIIIITCFQFHH